MRIGQTVVVVVGVLGQVAHVALGQLVGQAVVVRVVEHGQRKRKRFAVERVVRPHGQVDRGGGVHGRTADAAVHRGVSGRAPAEGQAFGQFAFKFPRDHVPAAVDPRQERVHRAVHEEVHVLRGVLQRERQVEVRVKRIADAVAVRVHRDAGSVGRTRGAASEFVGVRPRVVVIVQVLHQRGLARRSHTGHQLVGLAVAVGVLGTGRVEREGVGSGHAPTVGGRFGTVAHTVTVAVGIG